MVLMTIGVGGRLIFACFPAYPCSCMVAVDLFFRLPTKREVPVRRSVLVPALALLVSLGAATAHAQSQYDNRGLYDRIDRLERDLQVLQSQAARGSIGSSGGSMIVTSPALGGGVSTSGTAQPIAPGMAVRLDERVDQLEELLRQLTGRVEETNFKANQLAKQLERMQADIELRFKDIQGAGGPTAAPDADGKLALTPPKGADAPGPAAGPQTLGSMPEKDMRKALATPPATKTDPQSVYDAAYAAAQSGNYDAAEKGFQDFLTANPNHPLAGNAQYWLGDIAYAKKDFGTAAGTFLEAYKKYPKHSKAPDMIYKAGSSFGLLGKKKEACTAFAILFADQPNMPDRVKRAATAERKKYDCK